MAHKTYQSKPRILVFLGCYLPGFNSGGPVRTVSCMVEALSPHFDFYVVTLNRDSGSKEIYKSVLTGAWNSVGKAQVKYIPRWSVITIPQALNEVQPDILYLNGFFSTSSIKTLAVRRLGLLSRLPMVIAPRGDLAAGALGLKSVKKSSYIKLARMSGLYDGLRWHASSVREKSEMLEVLRTFGVKEESVHVAPDLGFGYGDSSPDRPPKRAGEVRFVTLSRIVRMKNLPFTLDRLSELRGSVSLDVFGPMEDKELWSECQRKIDALPKNISVKYQGPLDPNCVLGELSRRHFFILPTLGENYGHVIIEGAAAGCPVVISDRTQWFGLQTKGVGWDIPLEQHSVWRSVLQGCIDMPDEEYRYYSQRASDFGRSVMSSRESLEMNLELFRQALPADVRGERTPISREVAQ